MVRAIIMAGGDEPKWGNHLGVRRSMAPVDGEPLVHRTVRQLTERGIRDIVIVGPVTVPGTRRVESTDGGWGRESLNASSEWNPTGRTLLLYGDTVFSDAAMDTITGFDRRCWQWFGRYGASAVKEWGEVFAISFYPEDHADWLGANLAAIRLRDSGATRRASAWEALRIYAGGDPNEHGWFPEHMTDITDGTDDFDTPDEYARLDRDADS